MICKHIKELCCEDISLIENYEQAVNDSKIWECHHRKGIDEGLSKKQLKKMGLYFNRPADELIFLTSSKHRSLHHTGNTYSVGRKHSDEERNKISKALRGRKHSDEWNNKISETLKGHIVSKETRSKLSKPKNKYVLMTPDNELIIMGSNSLYYHPDWIKIERID